MASILFAVHERSEVEAAARHFIDRGHEVVIETDGRKIEGFLTADLNVLVTTVVLMGTDGWEVRDLAARATGNRVATVLLTGLGSDGVPMTGWGERFHSYLISRDPWQMILQIEQHLYFEMHPRQSPLTD